MLGFSQAQDMSRTFELAMGAFEGPLQANQETIVEPLMG